MIGLAVGDAIGAPVEGLKGGHIRQLYGELDSYVDSEIAWSKKPHRWRAPGLYSDDTQQAMALADTLVKCRGFEAKYFARLLADMAKADTGAKFGAHRGTGKNFRASVRALMDGADPSESGQPSAGIGAMMRAAPCGLYFAGDTEAVVRSAIEQGLVTHRDPRALVMAAALAQAVSLSVTGEWDKSKPDARIGQVVEVVEEAERLVERDFIHMIPVACMGRLGMAASAIRLLPRLPELPQPQMAFRQIVAEANRQFPEHKITEPGQGFVMAGGLSALFIALTATDFEDAVKRAVHLGKDTDTMAAIVGAVLGARNGEDAIPKKWRQGLVNARQVGLRGEALLHKSSDGLGIKDLVATEKDLTRQEEDQRKSFILKMEEKGQYKPRPEPAETKAPAAPMPSAIDRKKKRQKTKRVKAPWKK